MEQVFQGLVMSILPLICPLQWVNRVVDLENTVDVVFLDSSKAFNKGSHEIFVDKMGNMYRKLTC
jgi:hypothetical protein